MEGLKSPRSWRTFLVGFVVGYAVAWGFHWATTLYIWGTPVHHHIPGITPEPPEGEKNGGR